MRQLMFFCIIFWHALGGAEQQLSSPKQQFFHYTGAKIVFNEQQLPLGNYYEQMLPLKQTQQHAASKILLEEAKKYPPRYFSQIGLTKIGVFAACLSPTGDGFRPYNHGLKGYLYYGLWNQRDTVVVAFYTPLQLKLTFHHEVFHHVDATYQGKSNYKFYFSLDDYRYQLAVEGRQKFSAAPIPTSDLKKLREKAKGYILLESFSAYSEKSIGEDQAETASYFLTYLPDALLQMVTQAELPGSQRLLHLLELYQNSLPVGPDISWFVDRALQRPSSLWHTPYLQEVNNKIFDQATRQALYRAQLACVLIEEESYGVSLSRSGVILTASKVGKKIGRKVKVMFPDEREFLATCTHVDHSKGLALLQINRQPQALPCITLATEMPSLKTPVLAIGKAKQTKEYVNSQPRRFCVSKGRIISNHSGRGLDDGLLRITYEENPEAGSPVFNHRGELIAIHLSQKTFQKEDWAGTSPRIIDFLDNQNISYQKATASILQK